MIDGFDIVRGMLLDYMYGVLFGVVKMFFFFWFDVRYKKEFFNINDKIFIVDERFVKCYFFDFILRLFRCIKDRKYWKGKK